ncbi:hypothetical protein [Paenibacillus sp. FSL L8-0463]|uniref:hypothetical protein n=1 Tax=Paenibacillus sp. FSL L8-0463 TaxID=2954687 RepID=UPI00311A3D60
MSISKSPEEKLAELDRKMEQLKQRKKNLQVKVSQKERKQRTRNLIEIGAIFNKNFDVQTPNEAELIAVEFREKVKSFLKEKRKEIAANPPSDS